MKNAAKIESLPKVSKNKDTETTRKFIATSKYFVYIVRCVDNTYYSGKTTNIVKRFKQHNGIIKGGAKYTTSRKPAVLVHIETYTDHLLAARREIAIKAMPRKKKKELIG